MSPTGILVCCTVPSEAVPFVCLASVCRSLRCLISALTQAGGGGLLFGLLVPSRGGTGAAFPSTLLRLPAALYGAGPALRGSSPRVLHESADSAAPAFCAFPIRAAQATRSLTGALSPGAVRLLPSASPAPVLAATTLPADVDHPES